MIAVIGGTGTTGRHVVEGLRERGGDIRCIVRDETRARSVLGDGLQYATGDLADASSIEAACAGCDTLFLVSPHSPVLGQQQSDAIDAAIRAGVKRIVKLAGMMTNPAMAIPAQHKIAEEHLQNSDVTWTIVRPNFFMQNLLNTAPTVASAGKMMMPFPGDIPIGMIDVRDSAEICVEALTGDGYGNQLLEVTGSTVTLEECARVLSAAIERDIPYIRLPLDAAQKFAMDNGAPDWAAEHIGNIVKDIEAGTMSRDTGVVEEKLKRPPRDITGFFADHADNFRN
ncbi:MAG: NAD(P)H-binding protein [Alphaproteobacteria bacterium]